MTTIQQVEKHVIKKSHPYYNMFCEFTHLSKNLYNHANYLVRKKINTQENQNYRNISQEMGKWFYLSQTNK